MAASADVQQAEREESSRKRERQQQDESSDQEAEFELDDEPMQTDRAASAASAQQITPEKARAAEAARAKEAAEVAKANETVFSPELLRTYYARLFPHELLTSWMAYDPTGAGGTGSSSTSLFARREWSFTIEPSPGDEIYIRYQSFVQPSDLTAAIAKRNPHKID